ncbi:MAG: pyridoxamine 5'-phosphate oxidase family protein [Archaeoglobaceae archaeon]
MKEIGMSEEEVREFLSKPLIARIATVGKDLMPNVHPVWFLYDGEFVYVSTAKFSAKARNVKRNPKVAIVIDVSEKTGNKGVIIRGNAEIVENEELAKRILLKYLSPQDPEFQQLLQIPRVVIKIKPQSLYSWDSSKMFKRT